MKINFIKPPEFNFSKKIHLVIIALLLIGACKMPYGYYTFLRIVIFGFTSISSYKNFEITNKSSWPWLYLFVAIIFNPIFPIYLSKELWMFIDISFAILLIFICYKIKNSNAEKKMQKL